MKPAVVVALLWLLFGGLHIGLASRGIRARLVARLGEWGFSAIFFAAAAPSFVLLVWYYATHRFEGVAGLALGEIPILRVVLASLIVIGVALVPVSLWSYPSSADAVLRAQPIRGPRGIYRITRHPFFTAMVLIAIGHALLASHLVGTVFFAGLLLLSTLGPAHQSRKLVATRGEGYAEHLASTSAIPFAAILAGRQRLVWSELRVAPFAVGLVLAWALRTFHDGILAYGGAWVSLTSVGGAAVFFVQAWLRARREQRSEWWVSRAKVVFGDSAAGRSAPRSHLSGLDAALPIRRVLAGFGGVLVTYVGLCHEVVGPTLFPHADAWFGGWALLHVAGLLGIALGLTMIAGALGIVRVPLASFGLAAGAAGAVFVVAEAVSRQSFHFFAFTLLVAGSLVALTGRDAREARP